MQAPKENPCKHEDLLSRLTGCFSSQVGESVRSRARALCRLGDEALKSRATELDGEFQLLLERSRKDLIVVQKPSDAHVVEANILREIAKAELASRRDNNTRHGSADQADR